MFTFGGRSEEAESIHVGVGEEEVSEGMPSHAQRGNESQRPLFHLIRNF